METYSKTVKGIVTALSPISHGLIRAQGEKDDRGENNILRFRQYPFIMKKDGIMQEVDLYCVSGNSLRGIGRRLLYKHMFMDVLGLDFDDLLKDYDQMTRRYVVNLFYNGGSTPPKSTSAGSVTAKMYDDVLRNVPFLDMLGGVYITHHFNGHAVVGIMIPRTKETKELLVDNMHYFDDPIDEADLIAASELKVKTVRHSKSQSNKDASTSLDKVNLSAKDLENLKSAAIYGTEVLPAGTSFYWSCGLRRTANKGTLLAFDAFLALIQKVRMVGGMSGKGYGLVDIKFDDFDGEKAIKDFDDYLIEHKDDIISGIRSIAADFKYTLDNGKGGKKKAAKKGAKADAE